MPVLPATVYTKLVPILDPVIAAGADIAGLAGMAGSAVLILEALEALASAITDAGGAAETHALIEEMARAIAHPAFAGGEMATLDGPRAWAALAAVLARRVAARGQDEEGG
jgi:hypothetical protein